MNQTTARSLLLAATRRALLCVFGTLAFASTPASCAEPMLLDGVAAIVNDDVVLLSELRSEVTDENGEPVMTTVVTMIGEASGSEETNAQIAATYTDDVPPARPNVSA